MSRAETPNPLIIPKPEFIPGTERVIFTAEQIDRRIHHMALKLAEDLSGNPVFVWVRRGGKPFMDSLEKEFGKIGFSDYEVRAISVTTYPRPGDFTQQIAKITRYPENTDFEGRIVVGVDDVVDRGLTKNTVLRYVKRKGARQGLWVPLVCKTVRAPGGQHELYLYGFIYPGHRWLWGRGMNKGLDNKEEDEKTRQLQEIRGALVRFG